MAMNLTEEHATTDQPSASSRETLAPRRASRSINVFRFRESGTIIALLALCLFLSLSTNTFLRPMNILNILRQMAEVSIIAVGMTMLIITGEFDLSVGSMFGLGAVITGLLVRDFAWDIWLAFALALLVAAGVGLFNGILTTKVKIPSFIVTLGMLSVLRGAALVLAQGYPITGFPDSSFFNVLSGQVFGFLPSQVIWMIAINVVGAVILSRFVFGYHVYSTGSNKRATMLSGISTDWVQIRAFMITSILAAFSGGIMVAHLSSATPLAGQGNELDVIAAVVIGGTALAGGSGSILGTFLGAAIMSVLRNGLVLLGVSSYWQVAAIGAVIIIAVVIDTLSKRAALFNRTN
jgi:ribose transport system permease protein